MAYVGKSTELTQYLESIGRPLPPNTNPADFMLDLINKDFSDPATVDLVVGEWEKRKPVVTNMPSSDLRPVARPNVCKQFGTLLRKHVLLTRRDPLVYVARMIIIMLTNVFVSILYIEGRQKRQERALSLFFYLFFAVAIPGMFSLITVLLSHMELQVVRREVKDGGYSTMVYWLVGLVIQIPFMFLLGLCQIFPSMYPIMGLAWAGFHQNLLINACGLWALEAAAQTFSVDDNPLQGLMNQMNVWFFAFTYAGVWLPVDDIIWPFRAFCYVLPYRWQMPAVAYAMLAHTDPYEGAHACDPVTLLAFDGPLNGTIVTCNPKTLDENGRGFYCDSSVAVTSCYGRTGKQILDSFGMTFMPIQSTDPDVGDDFWFPFAMLLVAMGLFFKVVHLILITKKCGQNAAVAAGQPGVASVTL
eukprot:7378100-Prymnesium_polylepis.2